jgi:hypothetical protein
MSDDLQDYVLLSDGARHEGQRYERGDLIRLPRERGEALTASGSVRPAGDEPDAVDDVDLSTLGQSPVAAEASSIGPAQSIDADGEIKPESFAHPDRIEEAEAAAEKAAARAKPADSTPKHATRKAAAKTPATATE